VTGEDEREDKRGKEGEGEDGREGERPLSNLTAHGAPHNLITVLHRNHVV